MPQLKCLTCHPLINVCGVLRLIDFNLYDRVSLPFKYKVSNIQRMHLHYSANRRVTTLYTFSQQIDATTATFDTMVSMLMVK